MSTGRRHSQQAARRHAQNAIVILALAPTHELPHVYPKLPNASDDGDAMTYGPKYHLADTGNQLRNTAHSALRVFLRLTTADSQCLATVPLTPNEICHVLHTGGQTEPIPQPMPDCTMSLCGHFKDVQSYTGHARCQPLRSQDSYTNAAFPLPLSVCSPLKNIFYFAEPHQHPAELPKHCD